MKNITCIIIQLFLVCTAALADTPPPGTVKAKMYSGDGNTAVNVTAGSMNVNVTGGSGLTSTVNQGTAGVSAWLVDGSAHTQPVSGTFFQATQPVSGTLTCNAGSGTLAVSGPLTDAQLRATAVPVSGTFFQATQPVSGPLTDAQLRATAVPVSGTITATNSANGTTGSAVPSQATQIGGSDGTNLRAVKVSASGVVSVDGSASTQPISAASLPLPAGAATATKQDDLLSALGSPFQAGGSIGNSSFGISGTLPAYASTPTFNLGTLNGAATAALQTTGNTSLASIATNTGNIPAQGQALAAGSMPVVLTAAQLSTLTPLSSVTVSGTVTANLGTIGSAATAANQATEITALGTINTTLGSPFQAGGSIGNSSFGISGTLPAYASTPTFNLGTLNGAATSALQTTGNTSLSSIDGKTPALGQALAASSVPVVLTAAQLSTLTPLSSVAATQSGSWTNTVTQATGSNLHVVVDTAPTTAVTQSGTWNVNSTPAVPTATTVKQAAITIGTSAVRLTTDGLAPSSTRTLLVAQLLSTSTANCYFGSSSVTSASTGRGVQMFAGQSFSFNNDAGDYYAICDTSSQTFFVTEQE